MASEDFLDEDLKDRTAQTRILLIEDDPRIAGSLVALFREKGWSVDQADHLAAARALFGPGAFDLLVVDRTLPDGEGLDFVADLRRQGVITPILMLTSMRDTVAAVEGLDRGADDYLGKPYDSGELVARVRALARRNERAGIIVRGALEIDFLDRVVRYKGRRIMMSAKLFRLLAYLAINSPLVVTRDMLLINVWKSRGTEAGKAVIDSKTADVHLVRLRALLKAAEVPDIIKFEEGDSMAGVARGWRLELKLLEA